MILVLAISVVGIAAILYWGLPAIDEMKANVEYRSVSTQFTELDSTIKELVAGTTEKTAKRWEPSINRGEVGVWNDTEPWLFAAEFYNTSDPTTIVTPYSAFTNFSWSGFVDGDNFFNVTTFGGTDAAHPGTRQAPSAFGFKNVKVEAFIVTGTSSVSVVNVTEMGVGYSSGNCNCPVGKHLGDQMDGTWPDALQWGNGTTMTFSLWQPNVNAATDPAHTKVNLTGQTFKFRIWSGSTLLAEAYYMNTSRIDYNLHTSMSDFGITLNNGGIITKQNGQATMSNSPPIPPVSNTTGIPRFFGRSLQLQGNASFAGENRFSLLISLYSTTTLASYDCVQASLSDCAVDAKIYVWGSQYQPWQTYLSSTGQGYHYRLWPDGLAANANPAGDLYLDEREWAMAYTLLESNVRLVSS
jgi:hypothetical protein